MRSILALTLAVMGASSFATQLSAQSPFSTNSLCFDGVDDYVRVPYSSSFPTQTFTVSAWVKCSLPTTSSAVIVSRGDDDLTDNLPWDLRVDTGGAFVLAIENSSDLNQIYSSNVVIADGSWHHVAATRNSSAQVELYVDGVGVASYSNTLVPSPNNSQALAIGCVIGTSTLPPPQVPIFFLQGGIDEVAMWNRPLLAAEVLGVFQSGVSPVSLGLAGYWSFDSAVGQQVLDSSPALNHGFLGDSGVLVEPSDPMTLASVQAVETVRLGSPANPNALLPGQTSGPVIGNKWDPVIDHTSFVPDSILDYFGLSLQAVNIPDPLVGTILCGPTIYHRFRGAGKRFNLKIPNDCIFVGVPLCTSGASFDPAGNLSLTNALDITIGSYQ